MWTHTAGAELKQDHLLAELDCYVMGSACREHARADDLEIARAHLCHHRVRRGVGRTVLETACFLRHVA